MPETRWGSGSSGVAARAALRSELLRRYPWLSDTTVGPAAVEAGECDRCGAEARLVAGCGPQSDGYLGRRCAVALGMDAWCDGHRDEATAALQALRRMPAQVDTVARLWWVATGEVGLAHDDVEALRPVALPPG